MKIGEFAELFDISIKTVRFYEEKGLIKPAYVDIYTGYRYYDENNIKEMSKILALKNLGLELSEIREFNNDRLNSKIIEYENKIKKFTQNINTLKSLSKKEMEVDNIKCFINDEQAIGKWKLLELVKEKDDFLNHNYLSKSDYKIDELYLMENGLKYWVISWTKGYIYINDQECPYEIQDNIMYVKIYDIFDNDNCVIAVYEKENDISYNVIDIQNTDNTDIPFEKDDDIFGFWKCVDFINNINLFEAISLKKDKQLYLDEIIVNSNNEIIVNFTDGNIKKTDYTKNYIKNLCLDNTLCKYEIKTVNNDIYMIVEWKSGDYIYGNMINGYYVLKKY